MVSQQMELQHVNVKVLLDGELRVDPARFIEVFHKWIRDEVLEGILIDVADYQHVPAGPGVMLIARDAQYSLDNAQDRYGLLYNRKAPLSGSNQDRFRHSFASAAKACTLLEKEFADEGPLKFSRGEFELLVNDRELAPNTAATFAACKPELEEFLSQMLGHADFTTVHHDDPRSRFRVGINSSSPIDLEALATR